MSNVYYLDNVALSKSHDNDATRHFAMTNVAAKRDPGRKKDGQEEIPPWKNFKEKHIMLSFSLFYLYPSKYGIPKSPGYEKIMIIEVIHHH